MDIKTDFGWIFTIGAEQNQHIVDLHVLTAVICTVIFLIVTGLLVAVVVKFGGKEGDDVEPKQVHGNIKLEIFWTAVPLLIVIVLGVLTAIVMFQVNPPVGKREPDVVVVGHQWWWEYRYPKLGITTANEMYLPVGVNQLIQVQSADVNHCFWVYAFGEKMDAIPGHPTYMFLKPVKTGKFLGTCAEFCGDQHSLMRIIANVVSPEDFDKWAKSQQVVPTTAMDDSSRRGQSIFMTATCVQCHRIAGTPANANIAPDLTHIGQRETIGAGVLPNNAHNLALWVQNAQRYKPGSYMPAMRLTDDQANDVASYLENLK